MEIGGMPGGGPVPDLDDVKKFNLARAQIEPAQWPFVNAFEDLIL
jgi:hypothetical protein